MRADTGHLTAFALLACFACGEQTGVEPPLDPGFDCSAPVRIFDGASMPGDMLGAGDPELLLLADQWFMLFNSGRRGVAGVNMYGAYLPAGAPLDSPPEDWTIIQAPLVEQTAGAWDGVGAETPSHVYGLDQSTGEWEARIYYTGYPSGAVWNNEGPVQVGYLYWDGSTWQRHGPPVLSAENDFERWGQHSFLGEPTVRYFAGKWHIWYLAGNPANLVHATSSDGRAWVDRTVMWSETGTNLDILRVGDRYEMVTGSLVGPYDPLEWTQGLRWWRSSTPSGDATDWSEPTFLLRTRDGPWWMQSRLLSPAIQYEGGQLHVFFRAEDESTDTDESTHIGSIACSRAEGAG